MDGLKNHPTFRGRPPFRPFSLEDLAFFSDLTRPSAAAADDMGDILNFCAMVSVADHQYPPTSSRQVGDVSPGRRSNRNVLDPSFQYAARCESFRPPSANLLASARFLAIICCMSGLLSHDLRRFVAQAIRAAVFFQPVCIRVHSPDSQFRGQSFQLVPFLKVHGQSSFGLFALLALIYILSLALSRIVFKNDYERNQHVT